MKNEKSLDKEYWDIQYKTNATGWDLGPYYYIIFKVFHHEILFLVTFVNQMVKPYS